MTWSVIIIGGLAILGIGGWFLYRWFKSGAMVAPLSDKEIVREQIRRDRKERSSEKERRK